MAIENLIIDEEDVIKIMLAYLSQRNYHVTMRTLEKESNVINCNYSDDVLFLRELVLDGDYKELLQYGNSFSSRKDFNQKNFSYIVLRQKFIELIYMKSHIVGKEGCSSVEDVVKTLSQLETVCPSKEEYNNLCWLLTVPNLNTQEEFKNWTLDVSRMNCFEDLIQCLDKVVPVKKHSSKTTVGSDRLIKLIVKGLLYEICTEYCQSVASGSDTTNAQTNILRNTVEDYPSNLFCWIHSLPYDVFASPFEQFNIDVQLKSARNKSSLETILNDQVQFPSRSDCSDIADALSPTLEKFLPTSPVSEKQQREDCVQNIKTQPNKYSSDFNSITHVSSAASPVIPILSNVPVLKHSYSDNKENANELFQSQSNYQSKSIETVHNDMKNSSTHIKHSREQPLPVQHLPYKQSTENDDQSNIPLFDATPHHVLNNDQFTTGDGNITPNGGHNFVHSTPVVHSTPTVQSIPTGGHNMESNLISGHSEIHNLHHDLTETQSTTAQNTISNDAEVVMDDQLMVEDLGKENSSAQSNAILGPVINGVRRPISDSIILQSNQRPPPSTKSQNAARDIGITIPELKGAGPKIKTRDGNKVHLKELIKSKEVKVSPPVEVDQNSDRHLDNEPNHEPNDEMIQYFAALMLEDAQAVRSVSFHPGGKFLAVGANSKILRICKVSNVNSHYGNVTGSLQVVFKRPKYHRGSIYSMGWSPDGRLLATGSNDKSIKVLQFDEHNLSQVNEEIELNVHQGTIRELMFVPNRDAILVSGGAGDGNINVSDIISQKVIGSLHGHTGNVLTVYAGENNLVASGGADNTLRLWDLRCERCIDVVMVGESSPASVALTEKYLAAGQEDGSILLYDVTAGRTMQNFRLHQSDCRSVRFSPDLNYLLTSSYDGTMSLMHLKKNLDKTLPKHYVVAQHEDKVIQCRWHPTENMFLSSSADRTAVLWTAVP